MVTAEVTLSRCLGSGQTCKSCSLLPTRPFIKGLCSRILGVMLACTKRKDLQKPKHLMQLCSNDGFSPSSPSRFWTSSFIHWLLPFPAQGGTKIPREGLLSHAALLPVKRPVCISYKVFGRLLFCMWGILGVYLSVIWKKKTTSHARQGQFGNTLVLDAAVLLTVLILLHSTRSFPLQHFPAFSMPVSRVSSVSISQNNSCQGQAGRMCCCALHPAGSHLQLC